MVSQYLESISTGSINKEFVNKLHNKYNSYKEKRKAN